MNRVLTLSLVLMVLLTSASGLAMAQDEMEGWTCPEEFAGQTLRVFNWATYVAEDTIPNFEEACGVTVEYTEFGSNEEAVNIIRSEASQFDIVVPSGGTIAEMIRDELLVPLDHDKIPNMANILPDFLDPPYDPGNAYSIPYQWGTIGIGYDATLVDEPLESWADFFGYSGRVAWLDDQDAMLGIALLVLGYDPNTLEEAEVQEAAQWLLENNQADVFQIAPDTGQDLLVQGEVDAVVEYSGDIFQLIDECECDDYVYVIPSEGSNVWTDNMAIPFNAPNPDLAHVFIDYILDAQVGADLSNYTAYGTPNAASIPLLDEELANDPGIYPSEETLASSFIAVDKGPEAAQYYSEAWNMINSEIGQ